MAEELGGPFVQIAAFCQTGLVETGGQLSVIRIIDRVPVPVLPGEQAPQVPLQLTLAVVLKSGFFNGKGTITIRPKTPSGADLPPAQFPALFEGNERGVQILLPLAMMLPEEGLYWFEVLVNDVLLTKIALRVMHQPAIQVQMGPAPGQ